MRSWLSRIDSTLVAVGAIGAVAATIHTAINLKQLRAPTGQARVDQKVSALVPARNEATNIGHCLSALRRQLDVPNLEILVFDDGSTDGTAQVISHHLEDIRVRMVPEAGEPPSGWLGKPWACHQLAERALGEVLVFVDADVVLAPRALCAVIELLADCDAASPYPQQVAKTWAERLVQPLLQWSWLTFLPLDIARRSDRPALTAANGQFLAITREAYDTIGGHAAVRSEVLEDLALFRALKRCGLRGSIADGTALASCRMYDDWPQLRDGYTKSLWAAFGSESGAATTVGLLNLCYVLPAVAAVRGSRIGLVGYLAGVTGRALVARRVGAREWPDTLAHPASVLVFSYLVGRSARARRHGTLRWKDRPIQASNLSV